MNMKISKKFKGTDEKFAEAVEQRIEELSGTESATSIDELQEVLGRQYKGYELQTGDYSVIVRDSSGKVVFECVNDTDAYEWIDSIVDKDSILSASALDDADYLDYLCDLTVSKLGDKGYSVEAQISEKYITINVYESDSSDEIISTYLQPIEDIEVIWSDLENDANTLVDAVVENANDGVFFSESEWTIEDEIERQMSARGLVFGVDVGGSDASMAGVPELIVNYPEYENGDLSGAVSQWISDTQMNYPRYLVPSNEHHDWY